MSTRASTSKRVSYGTHDGPLVMLHCWFCGLDANKVPRLIFGPQAVCICNVCVGICVEMLADATAKAKGTR